jgi:uncharacterized protein
MIVTRLIILFIFIEVVISCELCRSRVNLFRLTSQHNPPSTTGTSNNMRSFAANSDGNLKDMMIDSVKWYKSTLSPLMPPNCRFLPTCSSYSIEAIEEFGAWKGGVLTAWRIMRCNPSGGSGYDPPQWPPPSYFAGSNSKRWF